MKPLHYAIAGEQLDIVKFLVERGADLNFRTSDGTGPSPLNIAVLELGEDHPITKLLIELGAEEGDYEPSDEDELYDEDWEESTEDEGEEDVESAEEL